MSSKYDSSAIEVLQGLEPVRKRPGMYTQTERPNHLAQEVIDNSADEALAGYCRRIDVTLHDDGSLTVSDDGRGMPIDQHKTEKLPGVEVILTRLHAGAKFSNNSYKYAGGLHGVGVSVVNALSEKLVVRIKRGGKEYEMTFRGGERKTALKEVGSVGQRNTGTTIRFWPDPKYFDSPKFSVPRLKHTLRAKAVLAPGLTTTFTNELDHGDDQEWHYEEGISTYLSAAVEEFETVPEIPFTGHFEGSTEEAEWALVWVPEGEDLIGESYVNLIPTAAGGTHVNGFRTGLTESVREFCEFRNLLPRGVKISPDDVWADVAYVLAVRMTNPQFTGQTKDRLSSRETAAFVSGVTQDALSLWMNQHVGQAEAIAALAIERAQSRLRAGKKVARKKTAAGPALPGKLADCSSSDLDRTELFLVEGDSAGGSAKQARDREFQAIMPLRGKILNTWEVDSSQVLGSQEVHDIAVALGVDPGVANLDKLRYGSVCILADADSDGLHIATLLCGLFLRHFRPLVEAGRVFVAMPPLFRIDAGKNVYYALDEAEKKGILERLEAEGYRGRPSVQRFKGLGEMNPLQLRETTMAPDTRRLIKLVVDDNTDPEKILDMLLAKGRSSERREWLMSEGDRADLEV